MMLPPKVDKAVCALCDKPVGPGAWCGGCISFVCWKHHNPQQPGKHTIASHKYATHDTHGRPLALAGYRVTRE